MIHDEHIETMRDSYDDHGAELAAKDAEIERLRAVANRGGHLEAANAEIERLREDNGKLRAALLGQEVGLQSEIERLRGLLWDYMRAAEDTRVSHDDFQDGLKAWEQRVREALGE